jgi:hypothetical protein
VVPSVAGPARRQRRPAHSRSHTRLEGLLGPLTINCHHDPLTPGPDAVRCKITGRLNFVFASHDQGESLSDEERRPIVPNDCR